MFKRKEAASIADARTEFQKKLDALVDGASADRVSAHFIAERLEQCASGVRMRIAMTRPA